MSPSSKNNNHSSSNRNGENVIHQTNILASAYVVDASTRLTGFHYSTTGAGATQGLSGVPEVLSRDQGYPSPPSSPPLAAITSANELALTTTKTPKRDNDHHGRKRGNDSRREGAAYHIRGECERLFCETMKGVFLGEEGSPSTGSIGMGVHNNDIDMDLSRHSPPDENQRADVDAGYFATGNNGTGQNIDAWIEVWDYAGGCSFRGFVGGNGESKSLFAFFDSEVIGRDLKQGLMALIELAEVVFAVTQVVICVDRSVEETDRTALLKSLRWVGFELISLDLWAGNLDVNSDKWLLLGMEV